MKTDAERIEVLEQLVFGLKARVEVLQDEVRLNRARTQDAHVKAEVLKAIGTPLAAPEERAYGQGDFLQPIHAPRYPVGMAAAAYSDGVDYDMGQRKELAKESAVESANRQFEEKMAADFGQGALLELDQMVEGERQDDDIRKINVAGSGPMPEIKIREDKTA